MDLFAFFSHGDAVLGNATLVVGDERIGGVDDGAGTAVVPLQTESLGAREILLEIEDVLDLGAAETVDGLGVVTYHAEVLVPGCQFSQDEILRHVRILVLVHHNMRKAAGDVFQRFRGLFQQDVHVEEDVVEIHHTVLLAGLAVEFIDLVDIRFLVVFVVLQVTAGTVGIGGRGNQVVLGLGNAGKHLLGLVHLIVQVQLLQAGLDAADGIRRVVDCKGRGEADGLGVLPQEADKHGVEGSHPQASCLAFSHHQGDTVLHLPGRFFRKSQRQDPVRFHTLFNQVCNA